MAAASTATVRVLNPSNIIAASLPAARVAAAGEPRWLIQGLWPADAYGVLAAQEKAGKTWARHFACPTPWTRPGLPGRRGERATVRRIGVIGNSEGVDPDQLADQLRLCFRVPRLAAPGAGSELAAIQGELAEHPAALVVLDPLYLASAGGRVAPTSMAQWTWRGASGGWGRVGAVRAEAVQEEAEVPPRRRGRRRRGRPTGCAFAPGHQGEVFEGEVGVELAALLGTVEELGDLEQAGLDASTAVVRGNRMPMTSLSPRSAACSRQVSSR
jgi:AAA domain